MRRLIEVDLPIKKISAHARREKSIRHGHISTLHIWWARRPLAACRAVICAALWLDPMDEKCPQSFREKAASIITHFAKHVKYSLCDPQHQDKWLKLSKHPLNVTSSIERLPLRQHLLDFIADFANWDCSTVPIFLSTARALTEAAHEALGGTPGTKPLVVDPFAGGGSIPLEALRVGADAFASDLNPVAVLLNKVVLEYIPKYGTQLAEEVRKWGTWIKDEAKKELSEFYPKDPDGATPIAYLWARTIRCEGPNCGAEVPLVRSLALAKKANRSVSLQMIPRKDRTGVDFQVKNSQPDNSSGTVNRGNATCPCCGFTTPVVHVRAQLKKRHGGANDARLMCVVTTRPGQQGRFYRTATQTDIDAVKAAEKELKKRIKNHKGELSLVPDESLPLMSGVFNAPIYGLDKWSKLFSERQLLSISTFLVAISDIDKQEIFSKDKTLSLAITTLLNFAVDKLCDLNNSLCVWEPMAQCPRHLFGKQAIGMCWDFAEGVSIGESSGCFLLFVEGIASAIEKLEGAWSVGQVSQSSAQHQLLPNDSSHCFFTDPPYYNAVPYADLSDFFYVWQKRYLGNKFPNMFSCSESPKNDEICEMSGWDSIRYPHKTGKWFEEQMQIALEESRRVLSPNGIGVVVFAHKSTSGWETLLQATINAGWIITGSWPVDTECGSRLRAMNSAALASSIHLVCRPRIGEPIGDWRDVLQELPVRIHNWMPRLAKEGVVGADAIFACLGPALEVFSKFSRVEKASGEVVPLREYLELVWGAVSKEALSMIFSGADTTGFEEDARLTSIWLWTLSAGGTPAIAEEQEEDEEDEEEDDTSSSKPKPAKGFSLEYDAARKIAQGLGIHLEQLGDVVEIKGDKARLLAVEERAERLFKRSLEGRGSEPQLSVTETKKRAKAATYRGSLWSALGDVPVDDAPQTQQSQQSAPLRFALGDTVLDRVHQSMLLFAAGRSDALKRFLVDEGVGRDQKVWRLAQSLSALYPAGSNEKRWVDGVLARKKILGF